MTALRTLRRRLADVEAKRARPSLRPAPGNAAPTHSAMERVLIERIAGRKAVFAFYSPGLGREALIVDYPNDYTARLEAFAERITAGACTAEDADTLEAMRAAGGGDGVTPEAFVVRAASLHRDMELLF